MTPLPRFTASLATLGEAAALREQWQALLGEEFPLIEPWLQSAGTAAVIQRSDAAGRPVSYRIHRHSKADLVGVDDEDGERIAVALEDTVLWSVRWPLVTAALQAGLGLTGTTRPLPGLLRVWELGRYTLTQSQSVPVFVAAPPPAQRASTCLALLAQIREPGIVLVPDLRLVDPDLVAAGRAHRLLLVGMRDALALDPRRRWVGRDGPETVFGDLRAALALPQAEATPYRWERCGPIWQLAFAGEAVAVEHKVGFLYLSYVIEAAATGESLTAVDIVTKANHAEQVWQAGSLGTTTTAEDNHAVYARVQALQEQMERAEKRGDHAAFDRLEVEKDQLFEHLQRDQGKANQGRPVGDGEDARKAVDSGIHRALAVLRKELPALAEHLKRSLRTPSGSRPRYVPEERPPWVVSRGR